MLTDLPRCWSAALTPTLDGLTSSARSRSVPARRAVIVPPAPSAAMATPTPRSFDTVALALPGPLVVDGGLTGATGAAAGLAAGGVAGEGRLGGLEGGEGMGSGSRVFSTGAI